MAQPEWQITNATLVDAEHGVRPTMGLHIRDGRIARLFGPGEEDEGLLTLNLHGLAVFPGWINSHDSLLASYTPFQGSAPHLNWLAYDNELKASERFKERMLLSARQLYLLGAYRNLAAGVVFVVDHIPAFVREPLLDELPVGALADYALSHSICSYSLGWGEGPRREYARAETEDLVYITHIAEGLDPESRASLQRLEEAGGLGERSVLVHGIGLSESDLDLIAEAGASLVWCPAQNQALYGRSLPVEAALDRGIDVCLGSDAVMFGSANLLADFAAARKLFREQSGRELAPETLLAMVTSNPARAFRLGAGGVLEVDAPADLTILRGKHPADPLRSLAEASADEIYLATRGGRPLYGDAGLESVFTSTGALFDRVRFGGADKIVVKGLRETLDDVEAALGRPLDSGADWLPERA